MHIVHNTFLCAIKLLYKTTKETRWQGFILWWISSNTNRLAFNIVLGRRVKRCSEFLMNHMWSVYLMVFNGQTTSRSVQRRVYTFCSLNELLYTQIIVEVFDLWTPIEGFVLKTFKCLENQNTKCQIIYKSRCYPL